MMATEYDERACSGPLKYANIQNYGEYLDQVDSDGRLLALRGAMFNEEPYVPDRHRPADRLGLSELNRTMWNQQEAQEARETRLQQLLEYCQNFRAPPAVPRQQPPVIPPQPPAARDEDQGRKITL